jgi:HPt (histidine-containing phosphotransfer) domain-containing protein
MIPIDLSLLEEYACGDAHKLSRLTRLAYDSISEALSLIGQASQNADLAEVYEYAHRVKSTARHAGADSFADACIALEQAARQGQLEHASELSRALLEALPDLRRSLAAALQERGADKAGL